MREEEFCSNFWGLSASIDIYGCCPEVIRSSEKIQEFVIKLCDLIEMKRFGETQIIHFGEDEKVEGFSMTQLIETSLISAHFANASNTTYLDVFSCKYYNPEVVCNFAKEFFKGDDTKVSVNFRK